MNTYIILVVCILALVCQIISLSTNHWSQKTFSDANETFKLWYGPWKMCHSTNRPTLEPKCHPDYPDNVAAIFPKESVYVCRYVSLIGILLFGAAIATMYFKPDNHSLHITLLVTSAVFWLFTVSLWAAKLTKISVTEDNIQTEKFDLGYSYFFGVAGGVLTATAAVLMYVAKKK